MRSIETLVIGGGPAGLCAAISAAEQGCKVTLVDRSENLGGQLIKQTHMFFGSEKQHASVRGIDITNILLEKAHSLNNIEILENATVLGIYDDGVVTIDKNDKYMKVLPKTTIVATGASEKSLAFPNNDLPGIYGAGAVQTLMNVYGVKPGNNVLMVGAGNIGLIVSYQLLQAGVNIKAVIDASPTIGGYLVHASKLRRMGVPIYTSYTIKEALGKESLEGAIIWELDNSFNPIEGTEKRIDADVMCIAVGLSPLTELLWQAGCNMKYIGELGGFIAARNEFLETSVKGLFVAGDVAGVEEASSAMVEGYLAGLSAARYLGYETSDIDAKIEDYMNQLKDLRSGPTGSKIRAGIEKLLEV